MPKDTSDHTTSPVDIKDIIDIGHWNRHIIWVCWSLKSDEETAKKISSLTPDKIVAMSHQDILAMRNVFLRQVVWDGIERVPEHIPPNALAGYLVAINPILNIEVILADLTKKEEEAPEGLDLKAIFEKSSLIKLFGVIQSK